MQLIAEIQLQTFCNALFGRRSIQPQSKLQQLLKEQTLLSKLLHQRKQVGLLQVQLIIPKQPISCPMVNSGLERHPPALLDNSSNVRSRLAGSSMFGMHSLGCTLRGADGRKACVAVVHALMVHTGTIGHHGTSWRCESDVSTAGARLALAVDTINDRGFWRARWIDGNGAVPFRVPAMTRVCSGLAMRMLRPPRRRWTSVAWVRDGCGPASCRTCDVFLHHVRTMVVAWMAIFFRSGTVDHQSRVEADTGIETLTRLPYRR